MKKIMIGYLSALYFLYSCGMEQKTGDETVMLGKSGESAEKLPNSNTGTPTTSTTENCSVAPSSPVLPFSFEEAQAKCAACHGATNKRWSTGGGTPEDWRAVAESLRSVVENDTMPMPPFSSATNDKSRFIAFLDQLQGKKCGTVSTTPTPNSEGTGSTTPTPVPSTTPNQNPSGSNPMMLDEAKTYCVSCHDFRGGGAAKWATADGTAADWAAVASTAWTQVNSDLMPPGGMPSNEEKTRMLDFLSSLMSGGTSPTPATPTPATPTPATPTPATPTPATPTPATPTPATPTPATPTPATPTPPTYTFSTASQLCISCHGSESRRLNLDTEEKWRANKTLIYSRVNDGTMPVSIKITTEERNALLNYINSL